jgi:NAD(P)-dependent dehydrogenase (short-subunit alcohol dehydrogenase family)
VSHGQVALVTGGASGIGESTARYFAARDAAVLIVDVAQEDGERVRAELSASGASASYCYCDLRNEDSVEAAVKFAFEHLGGLDAVANIAGTQVAGELHETSRTDWDLVHEVNLRGSFFMAKHAVNHWLERGRGGSIINIASVSGMHGEPGAGAYSVSKHGVIGLTRVLAATYGPMGIRCNAISPGSVRTPLLDRWLESRDDGSDLLQRLEGIYPLRRLMQPEEIAATVYFLASDAASAINGVNLPVDGGLTATTMEQAVL